MSSRRTDNASYRSANQALRVLLGLTLVTILATSTIPVQSYALESGTTYLKFDGSTHKDIPSSAALKLSQFMVEVRFRVTQAPADDGFLVSKSAGDAENRMTDHNYAMFVTQSGQLAGGFRATDGSRHTVYADGDIVDTGWHTARVVYDGVRLKLKLDGVTVESKTIGKNPDASGTGPLRMGANSNNPLNEFFVGDVDYVKILDRTTFKKAYFYDFGGGGGGTGSDPEPSPEPAPDPVPDPYPDSVGCSDIPMRQLRGAVYMDPVLGTRENGGSIGADWNTHAENMKFMKSYGMNLIRVPMYWEAYVHDPTAFLNEIELIAKTADGYDMCVIFDNHHWYTTSYWNLEVWGNSDGRGFPSFVVKNFPVRNNDYESTAGPFWNAFLSNSIWVNGRSAWDLQAEFFAKVISRADKYDSVAGYEILNEPHLFDPSQYEKLGNYHTYMAKKIRDLTDKKIFFDRETARGFQREPSSEYKIVPRGVSGLVYGPHLYSVPTPGSQGEKQLANIYQWSKDWGMEILMGEWSADTQSDTDTYVRAFKENGFGWTYYAWKPTQSRGGGSTLYDSSSTDPTQALKQLAASIEKIL